MRFNISLLLLLTLCWACTQNADQEATHDHGDGTHSHGEGTHSHADHKQENFEILDKMVVPATPISPEYIQLATNVEIIPNISDAVENNGLLTHEGIFGALLFAEDIRAFFIELKPGMFLSEHPHPTESLVYTVSGKWVLCSEGKRQVMEAGSLFHFGSNMPTGWEAPFAEGAFLLVVKSKGDGEGYEPYMKGLKEMQAMVDEQRQDGMEFYYNELPEDHEALEFARSVNPDFDEVLNNIPY